MILKIAENVRIIDHDGATLAEIISDFIPDIRRPRFGAVLLDHFHPELGHLDGLRRIHGRFGEWIVILGAIPVVTGQKTGMNRCP